MLAPPLSVRFRNHSNGGFNVKNTYFLLDFMRTLTSLISVQIGSWDAVSDVRYQLPLQGTWEKVNHFAAATPSGIFIFILYWLKALVRIYGGDNYFASSNQILFDAKLRTVFWRFASCQVLLLLLPRVWNFFSSRVCGSILSAVNLDSCLSEIHFQLEYCLLYDK